MKLSFSTLGCPGWGVNRVIKAVHEYGFNGVELRGVNGSRELTGQPEFSRDNIDETAKYFKESGVDIISVSTGINFTDSSAEGQKKRVDWSREYFEISERLGAPYLRVFGGNIDESQDEITQIEQKGRQLLEICEIGREYGVTVLLETHDSFCTSDKILKLIEENPYVCVLWDILHPLRFGESFEDTYAAMGSRIQHVHIKDSSEFSNEGFNVKLVGQGGVPIVDAVSILQSNNYKGYLSLEWEALRHPGIEPPEKAFPIYTEYMKHIL